MSSTMERSAAPTTMGNLDNLHREELLRLMEEVARKLGVSAPLGQGTLTEELEEVLGVEEELHDWVEQPLLPRLGLRLVEVRAWGGCRPGWCWEMALGTSRKLRGRSVTIFL